ncbi:MAG: hypothetical protein QOI57_3366, partial [Rubrobacteraceae bacterium]|nr:hypothetical protein [Rubrobacteraceae bacterium]
THPWSYEAKDQAEQHLRDEAAYPEGSPRRYNDVTSGLMDDDEERWKKTREVHIRSSSSPYQSSLGFREFLCTGNLTICLKQTSIGKVLLITVTSRKEHSRCKDDHRPMRSNKG